MPLLRKGFQLPIKQMYEAIQSKTGVLSVRRQGFVVEMLKTLDQACASSRSASPELRNSKQLLFL